MFHGGEGKAGLAPYPVSLWEPGFRAISQRHPYTTSPVVDFIIVPGKIQCDEGATRRAELSFIEYLLKRIKLMKTSPFIESRRQLFVPPIDDPLLSVLSFLFRCSAAWKIRRCVLVESLLDPSMRRIDDVENSLIKEFAKKSRKSCEQA